ncbi:putative Glycine-rich domain-containing protein [Rosa chinensis]|uniref:Putative Glycine-rich domain-containing protein n=1 Tax=Rosa chinensis TaxID=74649 RepID=A0A2P6PG49_ROSCH|nr:putative Glycine-rich domain-containing protein [Rosa chinensis]
MEMKQKVEWAEAQKIVLSKDLVLQPNNSCNFWQLLIEIGNSMKALLGTRPFTETPLVVPLDCEWIWHCHRLNPVCYVTDCETLYGKILDNQNVGSSIWGTYTKKTEQIWNKLYPHEPYELQSNSFFSDDAAINLHRVSERTKYDLVSISCQKANSFLLSAVARYKGFLLLIKRNRQLSVKRFCVPTYDIDLIWHCHQLHPAAYCKDLNAHNRQGVRAW